MSGNRWLQKLEEDPGHSAWYVERFRRMAAQGEDLHGEARFVDAMAPRTASILDAGCGPGRVGGRLAELGHRVVGVDFDSVLIETAREDHPDCTWLVVDLAEMELTDPALPLPFDLGVCAGNVMTFLDPTTRRPVLSRLRAHFADGGRLAVGFGAGRGYDFEEFFVDAEATGWTVDLRLSTWDIRPFGQDSDFLVAVLRR